MIKFKNQKQFAEAIMQAMKSGDEAKIQEAWENFHQALSEQIEADFEDVRNSNDAAVLAQRGYRQLTSKETKWYNKVIEALRSNTPKQAFATILGSDEEEALMPETIINDVFKDLEQEYPIIRAVNFQYVQFLTRWVLNDHTAQKAVWGEITDAIIKEITSAFKVIDVKQNKLSAYASIERGMLDLGPTFLDGYIRTCLKEALAYGLEDGIVNGNGLKAPIGLMKNVSEGVSVNQTTGYPNKDAIPVTEFNAITYGALLAQLAMTEAGKPRKFNSVALAVNQVNYFNKVLPATRVQAADGKYVSFLDSIFPTDIMVCNSVPENKALLFLPKEYYLLMGGSREGQIEVSDEYKFIEDLRFFKIKLYGAGRAFDNTVCLVLDIADLEPAPIPVKVYSSASDATLIESALYNVTAPVKAATPQASHDSGTGYTAEIAWSPAAATFAASTAYTATVTLTAEDGYVFPDDFGKADIVGLPATSGGGATASKVTVVNNHNVVTITVKYVATGA